MKILFKSLCSGMIIAILFTLAPFEAQCREISDEVFRVHILANSDSEADQSLKLKVRDAVIAKAEEILVNTDNKDEAKRTVRENLQLFAETAGTVILAEGYDYSVTVCVKNLYFDTRYYGDITMPGGFYDALQISIGDAKGKNWWCVMYPSLCLFAASKNDTLEDKLNTSQYGIVTSNGGYRYRFKIVEVFNSFLNLFS